MDKTIIGVYRQIIYSDGSIDIDPMPTKYIFDSVEEDVIIDEYLPADNELKVSERIKQIMQVLTEINNTSNIQNISPFEFKNKVSLAIKIVAGKLHVTESTVVDKISRQLNISKSDFVMLVYDFYTNINKSDYHNSNLYKTISSKFTARDDEEFTENTINSLLQTI